MLIVGYQVGALGIPLPGKKMIWGTSVSLKITFHVINRQSTILEQAQAIFVLHTNT